MNKIEGFPQDHGFSRNDQKDFLVENEQTGMLFSAQSLLSLRESLFLALSLSLSLSRSPPRSLALSRIAPLYTRPCLSHQKEALYSTVTVFVFKYSQKEALYSTVTHFLFKYSQKEALYSTVTVFVFKYSLSASSPKSLPKPDCLKPPKGAATSVLL